MPIPPTLLARACQLFATSPDKLVPLTGGHSNAVYKFPLADSSQYGVMRIGVQDCPVEQTLGMLEWAHYLAEHEAPVTAPLPSINGFFLEQLEHEGSQYILTGFENAAGTLAENIPVSDWTDDLFSTIGSAVGKFHRISQGYQPSSPVLTRAMWYDSYEIHAATRKLANSDDPAREKLAGLVGELKQLPTRQTELCLIHDDLHFANFIIQDHQRVTIIDFDDCQYGWPVIDVAMALFDVLVLYNSSQESEKQRFATHFLTQYLAGYRTENELSADWLQLMPRFLKLKELCIYSDLLHIPGIDQEDGWGGHFMRNRAERIANDIPYVDIDFSKL